MEFIDLFNEKNTRKTINTKHWLVFLINKRVKSLSKKKKAKSENKFTYDECNGIFIIKMWRYLKANQLSILFINAPKNKNQKFRSCIVGRFGLEDLNKTLVLDVKNKKSFVPKIGKKMK